MVQVGLMKAVPRPAFQEKRLHVSHDLLELHGYQPRGELGERAPHMIWRET